MNTDTIAAVATGAQVAAIGIIRLSGPDAISIADRLFFPARGGRMSENEDRKLVYGRLCTLDGALLDLCMCTISRAPHSYTGENTAELQCHGSPARVRQAPANSQSARSCPAGWSCRRQKRWQIS